MRGRSALYLVVLGIGLASGLFSAWLCHPHTRAGLLGQWLWRAELITYDYRLAYAPLLDRSPDIALVTIDEESLSLLSVWPWPRSFHAQVIDNLHKAGAKLIGVDLLLAGVSGNVTAVPTDDLFWEPKPSPDDRELARALQQAGNVVLAMEVASEAVAGREGDAELIVGTFPYADFEDAALTLAAVNLPEDLDGTIRRCDTWVSHQDESFPTMALALAALYNNQNPQQLAQQVLSQARTGHPALTGEDFLISYRAPVGLGFSRIPYYRVLEDDFDAGQVAGKIVLIGPTARSLQDLKRTPVSMRGVGGRGETVAPMPGVEVIAHATDTVLQSRYIRPLTPGATAGLAALFCVTMAAILVRLRPLTGLALGWLPLIAIAVLVTFELFWTRRLWIPVVPPVLGIFLTYTFGTVYLELTAERQRRRLHQAWAQRVSPEVLAVILSNPGLTEVKGRPVTATVFFSDLQGFTSFCDSSPPEEVVEQINKYLTIATQVIRKHGGTLHKFIGDGVMAVFGDPVSQPDHAQRAVAASVEVQQKLAQLRENQGAEDWPMFVRIGLHTGELVAGDIGSQDMLEYTVMGDTVSIASRLEGINKELGTVILMSQATAQQAGDSFALQSLGKVEVRGREEPLEVYTVEGVG